MLTALDIINNFEQMSLLEMRKETGGDLKRLTTLALFKKETRVLVKAIFYNRRCP